MATPKKKKKKLPRSKSKKQSRTTSKYTQATSLSTQFRQNGSLALLALLLAFTTPNSAASNSLPQPTQVTGHFKDTNIILQPASPVPIKTTQISPPELTATSAIVVDRHSSAILFSQNPNQILLPASTTKIMTALIALENYSLDEIINITQEEQTIGQTMKLVRGETITVNDLLYGTLVASGNDAALALALAYPQGGYSGFVNAMNQKARDLHLTNTKYINVSGVESPDHVTTVADLARLAAYALKNPTFQQMVSTQKITVTSIDGKISHQLFSTNELLGEVEGVTGVKTGWTQNALECLVTSVDRENDLIVVVLKSNDRFGDTKKLIDWTYTNHTWVKPPEHI